MSIFYKKRATQAEAINQELRTQLTLERAEAYKMGWRNGWDECMVAAHKYSEWKLDKEPVYGTVSVGE